MTDEQSKSADRQMLYGTTVGLILGAVIGMITQQWWLWIGIGIALGTAVGWSLGRMANR